MIATDLLAPDTARQHDLAIAAACSRLPPLWPLQNFVAVNPFLGLADLPFTSAAHLMGKVAHSAMLMDSDYYLRQLRQGTIQAEDIRAALSRLDHTPAPVHPVAWLTQQLTTEGRQQRLLTVADWLDRTRGTSWNSFIVDEISKWCASYFDRGQSTWPMPGSDQPLFLTWKRVARVDRNPEVFGLPRFRHHVENLADSADAAIEDALCALNIPPDQVTDFLHRELVSVFGWSAHAAFRNWRDPGHPLLRQLLAIRLAYDTALLALAPTWQCGSLDTPAENAFTDPKYIAQLAAEFAFRSRLARRLQPAAPPPAEPSRKSLQAIFCIDVRSEVYRRALEAQSPAIQTVGFAGFFGLAVEFDGSARCPVLLEPRYRSHSGASGNHKVGAWKGLLSTATGSFSAIETGGLAFSLYLFRQMFARPASPQEPAANGTWDIPLGERLDLVAGALKNMSLRPEELAPLVLICGHGGESENNPYASALDCGACGGHKGDINARLAAALMNDPEVRVGLLGRGIAIPPDTLFIAGLHNTTTDDIALLDAESLSPQQRAMLEGWLSAASAQARVERSLPSQPAAQRLPAGRLHRQLLRRSADWSEVRPEWGLAGNAAFIAAPRSRTRHLNLQGRVFLHDYDAAADPDASVLQLILTAPVIVASWINLQYYGSTVNNHLFGSGNKVLHNVVGGFGVWEGNGGDLRTGLPLQSLHDGARWVHEPLRLQVFVEAPTARIDDVLRLNPSIRTLVENDWLHLLAIEANTIREWSAPSFWRAAA